MTKKSPLAKMLALGLGLAALALSLPSLRAADVYWDISGSTGGAGGTTPTGTWSTSAANWSSDSTGSSATAAWTNGNNAIFSAGTDATGQFTVTNGGVTVGNITQEEGRILVTASTLTLANATNTFTVSTRVSGDYDLRIDSDIAGAGAIVKEGAGILHFGGNKTYAGAITLNAGTLAFEAGNNNANNPLGTGTLNLTGGNFVRNWDLVTTRNPLNVTGSVNVSIIQNNPSWTISSTWLAGSTSGNFNVSNATINGFAPQASTIFITGDMSAYTGTISQTPGNVRLRLGTTNAGSVTIDAAKAKFFTSGSTSSGNPIDVADGAYGSVKLGELAGSGGMIKAGWSSGGNTTFEVGALNSSSQFAGALQDNPNGSNGLAALTKVGTGALALTLSTGNSYSAGTTVSSGILLAGNSSGSATGTGPVTVSASGTLGGTGRISPGGANGISISGVLAPGGSVSANTGGSFTSAIGTLTLDQTSSSASVLTFASSGSATFELNTATNDKVAIVGKADVTEVVFNNTVINFSDLSGGNLAAGQYILFQGDSNTNYGGLTVDGSGNITAGLSIGSGLLSTYPNSNLKLVGNNIVLNLVTPPPPVPSAPTNVTTTGGYNQVALSWTAVSYATTYKVYRSTTNGSGYTQIMSGVIGTSYTDTNVSNGTTYYYVVSAVNSSGESATSTQASAVSSNLAIGINFRSASAGAMATTDLAGVVRTGNWTNLVGPSGAGDTKTTSVVADSNGAAVGGMSVSFTGGNSSQGMFASGSFTNDQQLFNGLYDQFDGTASTVTVTGVPYATYDVYFYLTNISTTIGGSFTIGSTTYYVRGGLSNPTSTGSGYVISSDTTYGSGTDITQGNCVKFTGLTSGSFTCTFTAVNAGNSVMRNKVVGFQIVATSGLAPVGSAPPAPGSVFFLAGNNQATLSWNAVNTATSYYVKRSTDGTNWTTLATLTAFSATTYVDPTAVNGTTYYYKITAVNGIGQTDSVQVSVTPYDPATVRAIGVTLVADYTYSMAIYDLGGVVRVPYWNTLDGLRITGSPYSTTMLQDNTGTVVSGVSATYTLGNGGGNFVTGQTSDLLGNDVTLYANGVDQFNAGTSGNVTISGIPYSSYDVYVFNHDNGSTHGGSVTVNGVTKYVRCGAGDPNNSGLGYVESTDTTLGNGTDIQQGNYVRFAAQTSSNCTIQLNAVYCGDNTQRFRPCAVQIVSNTTVPVVPPNSAPSAPAGITASAGNRQVHVSWNASATATAYNVKRSNSSGSGFSTIATVSAPITGYCDLSASNNGTTYYYVVSAVNAIGEGSNSAEVGGTPSLPAWTPPARSVYQWSVPVIPPMPAYAATADPDRRAYLWIPPGCTLVRGLVTGLQNMLERPLFEDPVFRQACTDANLGIVWIAAGYATSSPSLGYPNMAMTLDPGQCHSDVAPSGTTIDAEAANELAAIINLLASESGHTELQYAPIAQVGHSAGSPFAWGRSVYASGALAGRVFALLPYKGTYPGTCPKNIPILHVSNQWAENGPGWSDSFPGDRVNVWNFRAASAENVGSSNNCLIGEYTEPGVGHYQHSSEQVGPIALFIKKAAQYRIPSSFDGTSQPVLNTIDPTTGYLVDPTIVEPTRKEYGTLTPVSYSAWQAAGKDPKKAYWYLDQEMAQAVCDDMNAGFSKKMQMIDSVYDNGSLGALGPTNTGFTQYYATLQPDGVSFKVQATFLTQSPTRYELHGNYLGFSGGPILFKENRSGALRQTGADTFVYCPDRGGVGGQGQPWEPFFIAYNLGDSQYRSADRPIQILNPLANTNGSAQTISFPTIPNQSAANLSQISLSATASSGLPVKYWMLSGPYRNSEYDNSILISDTIPAVTKYPMRSVVAAWQWGSPNTPQFQSAGPVYNTFWVFKDGFQKMQYETFGTTGIDGNGQLVWNTLPANASYDANPAGDGISNLLKYATGMNPVVASNVPPAMAGLSTDVNGGKHMTLTFNRIADPALTYTVEATDDLATGTWTSIWTQTGSSNVAGWVNVQDGQALDSSHPRRFLRLRVTD